MIASIIPGYLGRYTRRGFYKIYLKHLGRKVNIAHGVRFQCPENIVIGDNVEINCGTILAANSDLNGGIVIGNNALIGHEVFMHSGNHQFKSKANIIKEQGHIFGEIKIGSDTWVGAKSIILSGVTLGDGSVVGTGSIVTRSTDPYSINVGAPTRKIRDRDGSL